MAITLKSLRKMTADQPPRMLIYGTPGIGKTSLAAEWPDPVFLQLEDGAPAGVTLDGWGREDLQTFDDVLDALHELATKPHDFKTVVIDSVTEVQRLVFEATCARGDEKGNPKNNIEDFGYGKGYVYAQRVMQELIDGVNNLRRAGLATVLIAHSRVERFDDPESVSYDRYELDLHAKLVGVVERDMDAILLLKKPVVIKTEGEGTKKRSRADGPTERVVIHTCGKPAFIAKNRYGMPPTIEYKLGAGFEALARYMVPGGEPLPEQEPEEAAQQAEPTTSRGRGGRRAA